MSRKTRRRRPQEPEPVQVSGDKPINEERLRQRYARMEGRGVVIHFSPLGLTFSTKADNDAIQIELKHEPEN